jgi:hypothetical protein
VQLPAVPRCGNSPPNLPWAVAAAMAAESNACGLATARQGHVNRGCLTVCTRTRLQTSPARARGLYIHARTHTQNTNTYVRTYTHTYVHKCTHKHTHPTRALSRARRECTANVPACGSAQGLTTIITRAETRPLRPQTHAAVSRARTLRLPLPRPPTPVRFACMEAESSMMIFCSRGDTSFTCLFPTGINYFASLQYF